MRESSISLFYSVQERELTSCKYLEEYLKGREVEREQLLAAYQGLGNEHGQLSETLTQKQSQIDSLGYQMRTYCITFFYDSRSIELQKRTNDMIEMEGHIQELEEENNHYVMDLQAFERQTEGYFLFVCTLPLKSKFEILGLSRKVAALEEQVMMLTEDREQNEKELLASRGTKICDSVTLYLNSLMLSFQGFSVQVSQSKDTVLRELAQTRLICDRQGIELQQREAKIALLSNQLEAEVC